MRTVLLANGALGAWVGRYLLARGDLVGLVVHPPGERKAADESAALADAVPCWSWPHGREDIAGLDPECLLSVMFGKILGEEWLAIPSWRALNLHPALLPWNRGANPNVWPLVDGSPAGTTLHVMSAKLDAGDIVAQRRVSVKPTDTAESLYERLMDTSEALLAVTWPRVADIEPVPQVGKGSYHRSADLPGIDPSGDELEVIDRLRARTFGPYGAEFDRDGRRYRVRVDLECLGAAVT